MYLIHFVRNEAVLGMPMTLLAGNFYSVAAFLNVIHCSFMRHWILMLLFSRFLNSSPFCVYLSSFLRFKPL